MKTFSTHFMTIEPVCIVWNMTLQHHIDKVIFTLCLPFFPKASPMLGFSFSCWNRVGAIRKRRICGRYCYVTMLCVELLGRSCGGEGDCGENVWTLLFPCYLQLLGVDVGERDCGDESADDAVCMLFAAVGGRCWGARLRRRICGRCCYPAICSCCWG